MDVLLWFAGVICVFYGIKIVFKFMQRVYKRLTCNEGGIDSFLDGAEQKMYTAADRVAEKIKNRKEKNKPIVTIR